MDFRLSEDQSALQDGARDFCRRRVPLDRLRELEKEGAFEDSLWQGLAELGAFSLRVPEAEGGVGLGMAETALVFEELGRALVPGPLLWTHIAAPWIESAASGASVVGGLDAALPTTGPHLVEHLDRLDRLLVLRGDGVYVLEPGALRAEPIASPLDPLTPVHAVAELPRGERIAGIGEERRLRLEGTVLASSMLLGIAESTLALACDHALSREQFGRPIGSFQAIKHKLADMFVRQEAARAATYAAAATLDDPEVADVERAAAAAKLVAGDAAMKNSRACIQIHGGMGFTWEIPAHYYLKRTWVLESALGTVADHADRVAERIAQPAR